MLSLLWPGPEKPGFRLDNDTITSLDLASVISALSSSSHYHRDIQDILLYFAADPAVIQYRQDILDDLLDHPALAARFESLLPELAALDQYLFPASPNQTPLHEIAWRVGQLEMYVDCIEGLDSVFGNTSIQSEGLRKLRDDMREIRRDSSYKQLVADLPEMIAAIRNISSITIGVNLDDSLRPVEAILLAVNKKRFTGPTSSLLSMFFNKDTSLEGIAPLHSIPPKSSLPDGYGLENPMLHPLFRDLAQILKQISRPVAAALQRYLRMNIYGLDKLKVELTFYVGAAKLIQRLRISGLPMCRPEIAPMEERVCELESSYNLNLALRMLTTQSNLSQTMITNDVTFGPEGRIFVLTGPNQGGKTTYTQAIGVIQALAQAGLYVPASRARISPVDAIFTHFPVEERPNAESGRLGEEAQRLNDIFSHATRHSLILLNESLSSTSFGESLYLARDIARALRLLGARGIYATHLHELAASVNNLNETSTGDSKLVSLVSLVNENGSDSISTRTYKIVTGPPMGHSYAREIAARYGISYEQLAQTLRQRGVVSESLSKRQ